MLFLLTGFIQVSIQLKEISVCWYISMEGAYTQNSCLFGLGTFCIFEIMFTHWIGKKILVKTKTKLSSEAIIIFCEKLVEMHMINNDVKEKETKD